MWTVDLNADVGESFGRWELGDDERLLPHLTSANVACGFHAGDPATLRRTVAVAAGLGVSIGAQVGYRDLAGFGRRFIDVSPDDLAADVLYQLGALDALARAAGAKVAYLKPHGALYHAVTTHPEQADAVVAAVLDFGRVPILGFPGSVLLERAVAAGLPVVAEGFADRAYGPDGRLVPRSEPGAVLTRPEEVAEQALALVEAGEVGSLCIHGDSPGAPALAAAVRAALAEAGLTVAPFA
ncbi:LamB/YcsF family protein [Nocardioides sp. GY 10113]|uniref:5-oxoprolinase subunit PxpA n=1 Tax=Nocardioides sp. GY 10113 TaxID=2569761 RepID=UPI0010A8CDAB|nr:5-oxoprolinase subunit PxpA [Nocardioides sp. GY 10113]TIC88936.1 LamB/YcsF family protein [Nocardioides sp. GY 10113]